MRTFIYFIILTLCAVLLESCTIRKKPVVENLEKDTTEQFIPYVPTVYDVLQEREDWKYQKLHRFCILKYARTNHYTNAGNKRYNNQSYRNCRNLC